MAVTADTVEVRLKAQTTEYVQNLQRADAAFNKTTNTIENNSKRLISAGDTARSSFSGVAAQFQDIGVTAAAGMNPLIIALQQGTQLSAQLQQSAVNGQGVFRSLATGVAGLINPISIATIASIALGTALLQSIGQVVPQSESANQALKRHREELENVVRGYGAAEDAVKEYFDQVQRLPQGIAITQTQEAFDNLRKELDAFVVRAGQVSTVFTDMAQTGDETATKAAELSRAFSEGEISAEEFYTGMVALQKSMGAFNSVTAMLPGSLGNLINSMVEGAEKAAAFSSAINGIVAASHALAGTATSGDLQNALDLRSYIAEQERVNGLTADQLALEKEIARIKADAGKFGITDEKARELALQTLDAEKRRADLKKQTTEGVKAASEYERERQAVLDLLDAMGFEAALLGQSNREKAIAIALSKANATATEEERASIAQMAGYIYDTEQAIQELNKTSQEWANTVQSATRGFINDLIEGKSAAEAFGNVLASIGNKLIDMGLNSLFGSGGLNLAGIFGGQGFPTRATGGQVYAGNPTMINERGQEIFVPSTPGKIVPASQVGGGGQVVFAPQIDARGADVAAVARLEQSVQKMAQQIIPTIRKEMATAGKKGRT